MTGGSDDPFLLVQQVKKDDKDVIYYFDKDSGKKHHKAILEEALDAELIGKNKCRSLLSDLQAHRRSNGVTGRWVFLPTRKTKDSNKEKHGNRNFHFFAPDSVSLLIYALANRRQSTTDLVKLIRKPRQSRSPHSSRTRLLDDHRDPQIPWVLGGELNFHVSREPCGLVYFSDSDEVSQNRHVRQGSSGILSPAHMRFIAVVCYREENARRLCGDGRR